MGRRRKSVKVDYVQVPEEFRQARCSQLAAALTRATGRRVSRADALALAVDLWAWHLQQVNDKTPDLAEAFQRVASIPREEARSRMHIATGWPESKAQALLDAFSHPMVRVLEPTETGWFVTELQDRYLTFATKQQGNRARSRLNVLAHEHGWEPDEERKGTWTNRATGESGVHWKNLLARLDGTT